MKVVIPLVLVLLALAPRGEAQIGCGRVVSYLNPCIPYVTGSGPLGQCCGGVKGLYGAAKTTADRQSVCGCLKNLAQAYSAYIGKAASLPRQCGVSIPYAISPSTDCSKVK
ncbi:non-specific lipid-transfer protein 2-like [Dorcoceras hygrometricum]|uniref:Non-specific lipid-transfer protein n=1 Tax=Dorcoceras hygrometricum TaxID=472368 RepID=A0A2Z7C2C6_9LAMI|nr:non-specific lipid-transfer protein 2-like [Dorcoceras hygrometricum]